MRSINFKIIIGLIGNIAIALHNTEKDNSIPKTEEQFEEWQADRILNRTAALRTELIMLEKKRQALREFMDLARTHEGNMLTWLSSLENQDYPGKELGLSINLDWKPQDYRRFKGAQNSFLRILWRF